MLIGRDSKSRSGSAFGGAAWPRPRRAAGHCAPDCAPRACLRCRRASSPPAAARPASGPPRPRCEFDRGADVAVERQAVRHAQPARGGLRCWRAMPGPGAAPRGPGLPGGRGASRLAAADRGASSPRLPGTIQSSASSPRAGPAACPASLQQDSQSALMKRSSNAAGCGWPSLEHEDWACGAGGGQRQQAGRTARGVTGCS